MLLNNVSGVLEVVDSRCGLRAKCSQNTTIVLSFSRHGLFVLPVLLCAYWFVPFPNLSINKLVQLQVALKDATYDNVNPMLMRMRV